MCKTKYPILLVHGTGFRDREKYNYWGRIPAALEAHGAVLFYGGQDCWATIENNSVMLKRTLDTIFRETDCGKVNIIAHSKGGLEARYLAATLGCGDQIASITTIATPHHGSETLGKVWWLLRPVLWLLSFPINLWFRMLGDAAPDFYHTCWEFTDRFMAGFNEQNPDQPGILYQSYAVAMKGPFSDVTMCLPNFLIHLCEGENDGLVSARSAQWTNFRGVWRGETYRGISHPDAVDFRRRNFTKKSTDSADIRLRYTELVAGLKDLGL